LYIEAGRPLLHSPAYIESVKKSIAGVTSFPDYSPTLSSHQHYQRINHNPNTRKKSSPGKKQTVELAARRKSQSGKTFLHLLHRELLLGHVLLRHLYPHALRNPKSCKQLVFRRLYHNVRKHKIIPSLPKRPPYCSHKTHHIKMFFPSPAQDKKFS
jgi:hypothetical protein